MLISQYLLSEAEDANKELVDWAVLPDENLTKQGPPDCEIVVYRTVMFIASSHDIY
jgi:hypothetical protein